MHLTQHLLRCCMFNARSLVNKLPDLHYVLYSETEYDCILITESWLTDGITDSMLDPENRYYVLRYDRQVGRGGGVCALIKRSFHIVINNLLGLSDGLEVLSFDLLDLYSPYRVIVVYSPPTSCANNSNAATERMSQLIRCLEHNISRAGVTVICGDFNCPDIVWDLNHYQLKQGSCDMCQKMLCEFAVFNGLNQCTPEPTRSGNLLDLVFINDPLVVSDIAVTSPFSTSDHNSVEVNFLYTKGTLATSSKDVKETKRFKWELGDYDSMRSYLSQYNWNDLFTYCLTVDSLWCAFHKVLDDALDAFVPFVLVSDSQCKKTHRTKYPGYIRNRPTREYPRNIRKLMSRKRLLWRSYKKDKSNTTAETLYKNAARECKKAVHDYDLHQEMRVIKANNTGQFFKFINRKLGRSHNIGILAPSSGKSATTDAEKADVLNSFFSSVNIADNSQLPGFGARVPKRVTKDNVIFTPNVLQKICKKIKPKLTADPSGYPPFLLKQIVPAISGQLCELFQSFISVGQVPMEWKKAIIAPLFKKGISSDPSNYRPISLTSIFSKLMERAIVVDLLSYLRSNNLISKQQHGFISKRSTTTNLIESINDWSLSIENGLHQTIAYVDFAKAFDSVCHSKLIQKLEKYGIKGSLLQWIASFLSDRSHQTRVGNSLSDTAQITSGVIQGSCLGPLLFLLYINDLPDIFDEGITIKLYADDVKLYYRITAESIDSLSSIQEQLQKLAKWAQDWQLPISYSKCNLINLGCKAVKEHKPPLALGGQTLQCVEHVSDLGVTIDSKLKFSTHVANICCKAHRRANLILRCFMSRDISSLITAFNVYVRPILEYCSVVWNPYLIKDIKAVEKVQKRFTKKLPGMKNMNYYKRLKTLNVESLELRRIRLDLLYTYKILFGLVDVNANELFIPVYNDNRRGHSFKLFRPTCKSSARFNSFSNRVINIWNNLPPDQIDFSSFLKFKKSLNNNILVNYCKVYFS